MDKAKGMIGRYSEPDAEMSKINAEVQAIKNNRNLRAKSLVSTFGWGIQRRYICTSKDVRVDNSHRIIWPAVGKLMEASCLERI